MSHHLTLLCSAKSEMTRPCPTTWRRCSVGSWEMIRQGREDYDPPDYDPSLCNAKAVQGHKSELLYRYTDLQCKFNVRTSPATTVASVQFSAHKTNEGYLWKTLLNVCQLLTPFISTYIAVHWIPTHLMMHVNIYFLYIFKTYLIDI